MMFVHGGDIYAYNTPVLDFSANINPLGLPGSVKLALNSSIVNINHYPDPFCRELTKAIASREQVNQEQIFCGNGAADIIYRIAFWKKPQKALLLAPTFSEYETALKCINCEIIPFVLDEASNFDVDEAIIPLIKKLHNTDVVFICNPNNPTGRILAPELLYSIIEAASVNKPLLVFDECFLNFVENNEKITAKNYLQANVIVLKAFTKFYAMPGLRLGYAICQPQIKEGLQLFGPPWTVSVTAQAGGIAALEAHEFFQKSLGLIREERHCLTLELINLGFKVFESRANYILFKTDIRNLKEKLLFFNILIRDCSNYIGLGNGFYRIAIKNHAEYVKLLNAMHQIAEGVF